MKRAFLGTGLAGIGPVLAVLLSATAPPALAEPEWDALRNVPVQEGGRVKPFDTWARETLVEIHGKPTWEGNPAAAVLVSMMVDGDGWKQKQVIKVEHLKLKERCGLERERKYFTFDELVANQEFLGWVEELRQSGREDFTPIERAGLDAYHRLVALHRVAEREVPHVYPGLREADQPWMSLGELEAMQGAPFVAEVAGRWSEVERAALGGSGLDAAVAAWTSSVSGNAGWQLVDARRNDLEILYNSVGPFRKAWILYVAAFVLFLVGWATGRRMLGVGGMFLVWAGFLVHTLGLLARQYLAGRPPISNLYEALTFVVWGVVFLSILFEMSHRRRVHGTVAAVLGSIGLVLAETLPIERNLNPLVAVLRSYWLQYHVTTILLSYSALTLAAGLAHFHLFTEWLAPHRQELSRKTSQLLYTAMKIGVTCLATGIILGAVWASESWGRYWGWDPKETWSLITLMGYVGILHGRFAGWLNAYGVSVANVACWGLVLFTFYGVNYFLVGLHSYAGAGPETFELPPLLVVYLAFEALVVAFGIWYEKGGKLRLRRA
jgi:cytochrome c-type biogenesis protein CcsB